jgi:hypothetical protein
MDKLPVEILTKIIECEFDPPSPVQTGRWLSGQTKAEHRVTILISGL